MSMEQIALWLNGPYFLTALTEWFCCVCYIVREKKKRTGAALYLVCAGMLAAFGIALYLTDHYNPIQNEMIWLFFRMPLYCALMWLFLFLCCEGSKWYIFCIWIKAFLFAEFSWSVLMDIRERFWRAGTGIPAATWAITALFMIFLFFALDGIEKLFPIRRKNDVSRHEAILFVSIGMIAFLCATFFFGYFYSYFGEWFNISHTAADLIGLFCIFEYQMWFVNEKTKQELVLIEKVMEEQNRQYRISQENIAVINQKYHDIKHMIFLLQKNPPQKNMEWLSEIETEIRDFEAAKRTGNDVLDTMLTDRHLYCLRHGIEMTCVIDGKHLNDMREIDICTIFGNALSNAVECEEKIADEKKRLIHVCVFEKQGFLNIQVDNILEETLQFEEGLPVTTKGSREIHGYGLKSIRYTVSKYHGHMNVQTDGDWFELRILIPMPLRRE